MIRFVNSVAEDLEKDYPNLTIITLAYHYTQKPPLHVKPRKNVVVQLCDIHCSFAVPLSDDRNKEFRQDLLGWLKIDRFDRRAANRELAQVARTVVA